MAEDISQLIAEITRSPEVGGAASGGRLSRGPRGPGVRGIGWRFASALVLGACALVAMVTLMNVRRETARPHGRVLVRQPISPALPVRATPPSDAPLTISDRVAHAIPATTAAAVPHPNRQVRLAAVNRPHPRMIAATPGPRHRSQPDSPAQVTLANGPSPHLTGAALRQALAEDAVITRRLNLEQLREEQTRVRPRS